MQSVEMEIASVSKTFGGLKALQEISFTIYKGEILGIIGPNGSGKSTLFNVISGMVSPNHGAVMLGETNITGKKPFEICKMGIGRTFQLVKPFGKLTTTDNVIIGALFGNAREKVKEARKEAEDILQMLGFGNKLHTLAESLTLPEKKKLEVARALATKPKVLLLDEVMAGFSSSEVDEFVDFVKRINNMGITVLIIEHVMRAIMNLTDRVVVLQNGRVLDADTPSNVTKNPVVIESYLGKEFLSVTGN